MIRVVLVDDQTLVRSGIRGLLHLTEDIRVVAEAEDGVEARRMLARHAADVLLLDVRMPGCDGIELLRAPGCVLPPAIMLTTFDDEDALFEAMRLGARGFVLKDISLERLADGIRSVARGGTLFRPALTERIRASFERGPGAPGPTPGAMPAGGVLTQRETEVLALVAAGLSNGEIAAHLGASEGTVKNHVSSILAKLGVRDRVRAVLRGIELSLI